MTEPAPPTSLAPADAEKKSVKGFDYFVWLIGGAFGVYALGLGLALSGHPSFYPHSIPLALGMLGAGIITGLVFAIRSGRWLGVLLLSIMSFLSVFGIAAVCAGAAWGRPLRWRGRLLHPKLREGDDWLRGDRPAVDGLDLSTRRALEALWLHDAQKEHASVPAFARVGWLLAAAGAPPELLEAAHRSAIQEIDHARRCFALAAGYGGRAHTVESIPEMLQGGFDASEDVWATLAVEALQDGCLLEDFNADVATACEAACEEPAAKRVLGRIAREERAHADFSWAVLEWALASGRPVVIEAVDKALSELERVLRPTATNERTSTLVAHADPAALVRHGRLQDDVWGPLWTQRLIKTHARAQGLTSSQQRAA